MANLACGGGSVAGCVEISGGSWPRNTSSAIISASLRVSPTMGNVSEGNAAIQGLDGKDKGGRKLKVNEARPKDDRGGRPSPGSRR